MKSKEIGKNNVSDLNSFIWRNFHESVLSPIIIDQWFYWLGDSLITGSILTEAGTRRICNQLPPAKVRHFHGKLQFFVVQRDARHLRSIQEGCSFSRNVVSSDSESIFTENYAKGRGLIHYFSKNWICRTTSLTQMIIKMRCSFLAQFLSLFVVHT